MRPPALEEEADNILLLKGEAVSSGHSEYITRTGRTVEAWEGSKLQGKQKANTSLETVRKGF